MTKLDTTTNGTSAMSKQKKAGRPWWRPLVDAIDRRVTPRVKAAGSRTAAARNTSRSR